MRRLMTVVLLLGVASLLGAADDEPLMVRFKKEDLGKTPAGWKADQTGKGEGSIWKVVADETAPSKSGYVVAQTAEGPSPVFNLCVAEKGKYQDVELSVAFKAIKGKIDQGGGMVWRYKDANNYYIARLNPLEDNYRVYKVIDGKRGQLDTAKDLKVKAGEWHTLKVVHKGNKIECFLDGKSILKAEDDAFKEAGQVGLWTKADAQTYFDDFQAKPLK